MKKILNITISVVLVLILFISNAPLAFAADSIASFEVNNYGGDEDAIDTVKWYAKDETVQRGAVWLRYRKRSTFCDQGT